MAFKDSAFWIWWSEYGKHVEALAIIILLFSVWFAYRENSSSLKEVKEFCPCALFDNAKEYLNKPVDVYVDLEKLNITFNKNVPVDR